MPSILNLKFKGNKSFVAFSNLNDTESLTKTWKVCTKVASYLEQGQRLENLSWRLWHLQNLMVDTDNAKSKREFKKLSKCMGDKLDKEKGRSIEELPAPDFKRNPSTDLIRQRAVEKERTREASMHTPEHTLQRMQFTFAVEPATASSVSASSVSASTNNNNNNTPGGNNTTTTTFTSAPSASNASSNASNANTKRKRPSADVNGANADGNGNEGAKGTVRLPTLFSTSFGPAALLYPALSLAPRKNYGEAHSHYNTNGESNGSGTADKSGDDMRIARPTIELPLDELLNADVDSEEGGFVDEGGMGMGADFMGDASESEVGSGGSGEASEAGVGANDDVGMGVGGGEEWAGWDEIMRNAGVGGFEYYGPQNLNNGPAYDAPLTLDPHAAFAHHAHHFHSSLNNNNNNGKNDAATPTASGGGPPSPHLSPNAYFLPELEEHQHHMELDHRAPSPTKNGNSNNNSTSSGSPHVSSSSPNTSLSGSSSHHASASASGGNGNGGSAGRRRQSVNYDDAYDEPDPEPESSDDGGDDSADSDFFELSHSAARARSARARASASSRPRATHSGGGGGGGGGRKGTGASASAPVGGGGGGKRPVLSVRVPDASRSAGGSASAMRPPEGVPHREQQSLTPQPGPGAGAGAGAALNTAPGGAKAECSNCGATHTPLWRRGLNDELNCNACGLYCKLHKRPRPKTMRNSAGGPEGRGQSVRAEAVDVMAQCYNCHTTATPLWRKDDEGKTVCNACGLYYKLHGSARPISMKSDIIRKRSRHDARRGGASASVSETPTASPGVSRRASPAPNGPSSSASASAGRASPTLAPDSTTTHTYEPSELTAALGPKPTYGHPYYHEQYPDALPFASVDVGNELDAGATQRANKRRRMSIDSASEPPSSAVSYSSYTDGYTSASSQFSMEFPFSRFPNVGYNDGGAHGNGNGNGNGNGSGNRQGNGNGGPGLRGVGGNTFWHPPMMVQEGPNANKSPGGFLHPPMLPTPEEAPMDYLHPPMVGPHNYHQQQEEESMNNFFGGFMHTSGLHPPMVPGDEAQMMGMGMVGGAHPPMMPYEDVYDVNGNMHY
ncbi:hypothetical protein B0H19DRAFT_144388 [Mycena capillaripes]|nr:hypothetical protein B0H19DRAFT_144388 [Mycena capillaripes]